MLTASDMIQRNSKKIFLCHRVLGQYNVDNGLLIRLTVNSNLFGGSVANMGTEAQKKWLQSTENEHTDDLTSIQVFLIEGSWDVLC